jgi:DNA (cytosine-5)-methyltransferase 1
MKTLELFAGVGGFSLAAEAVGGFEVTDYVEYDSYKQKILRKHFPNGTIHNDIRNYKPQRNEFDLIVGGFPCRGTSSAGSRQGLQNSQSSLWWEMLRVIEQGQPRFVVIENPEGLLSRGIGEVLGSLRAIGYSFDVPQIISAAELGAPHRRKRVFVIAYPHSFIKARGSNLPIPWEGQIREQIEIVANAYGKRFAQQTRVSMSLPGERTRDSERLCFRSYYSGMDDGVSERVDNPLKEFNHCGWWEQPPERIYAPARSIKNRPDRIRCLGDAVTPQQASIALMRVNYLNSFL